MRRRKTVGLLSLGFVLILIARYNPYPRKSTTNSDSHLTWRDYWDLIAKPKPVGVLASAPLDQSGMKRTDLHYPVSGSRIQYIGKTEYLNNAHAVVTHT